MSMAITGTVKGGMGVSNHDKDLLVQQWVGSRPVLALFKAGIGRYCPESILTDHGTSQLLLHHDPPRPTTPCSCQGTGRSGTSSRSAVLFPSFLLHPKQVELHARISQHGAAVGARTAQSGQDTTNQQVSQYGYSQECPVQRSRRPKNPSRARHRHDANPEEVSPRPP